MTSSSFINFLCAFDLGVLALADTMEWTTTSLAIPSYKGLLRDEIFLLRQLLGYCDNGIELLNASLLPHSSARLGNMRRRERVRF